MNRTGLVMIYFLCAHIARTYEKYSVKAKAAIAASSLSTEEKAQLNAFLDDMAAVSFLFRTLTGY